MLLDTYGLLNLLELFFNCFDSLYQAEYEFQNSNVGGKYGKINFERFYKNLRTLVNSFTSSDSAAPFDLLVHISKKDCAWTRPRE